MLVRKTLVMLAKMYGYSPEMLLSILRSDSQKSREILGVKWKDDFKSFRCDSRCGCVATQVSKRLLPKPIEILRRVPRGPFLIYCACKWKSFFAFKKLREI
ncbi:hypothetical protein MHBO_002809 [Bonamia ostreae]|uniref:Uncharacterized protein n=1 Tax=Bonamia ostreae TaxID=126728 RepID=A0ABV2AP65_9EUKA